jgi:hypothetical protein
MKRGNNGSSTTESKPRTLKKRASLFLQSEEGKITRGHALAMSAALLMLDGSLSAGGSLNGETASDNAMDLGFHLASAGAGSTDDPLHGSHASHGSHGSHASHGSHGSHASHGSHGSHASHASHGSHGSW